MTSPTVPIELFVNEDKKVLEGLILSSNLKSLIRDRFTRVCDSLPRDCLPRDSLPLTTLRLFNLRLFKHYLMTALFNDKTHYCFTVMWMQIYILSLEVE